MPLGSQRLPRWDRAALRHSLPRLSRRGDSITFLAILAFAAGIYLVVEGAGKFVDGLLATAVGFGISTFVLGFIFGGFDLENLAVGIAGAVQGLPGISLGTVIGSSIFLLTFAVGATAALVPLNVNTPRRFIVLTFLSPIPLGITMWDGQLSRVDGALLLTVALTLICYIVSASRRQKVYEPKDVEREARRWLEKPRWFAPLVMLGAAITIAVGAELLGWGSRRLIKTLGWSDTLFGMVLVAAAVSFEELPRMLLPAWRGHPEVSVGNILGTIVFFVLFNVGVIALVRPLPVDRASVVFHWPFLMGTLLVMSIFLWRQRVGRLAGGVLLAGYVLYLVLSLSGGFGLPVGG